MFVRLRLMSSILSGSVVCPCCCVLFLFLVVAVVLSLLFLLVCVCLFGRCVYLRLFCIFRVCSLLCFYMYCNDLRCGMRCCLSCSAMCYVLFVWLCVCVCCVWFVVCCVCSV